MHRDLVSVSGRVDTGRETLTAEQVLRALSAKQRFGCSYEELAFLLADSSSVRAFCRVSLSASPPTKSTLQRNIKRVKATTWEQINALVIGDAVTKKIEKGRTIRSDLHQTEEHGFLRPTRDVGRGQPRHAAPSASPGPITRRCNLATLHAASPGPASSALSPRHPQPRRESAMRAHRDAGA